jgi:hypothetical protein
MALKGNLSPLRGLKQTIRALPLTVAADVSKRAAPALTGLTQQAFGSNQTVYGDARPAGVDGQALSLVKSGATRDALRFISIGTVVRCVLPTRYAKYLIGRYGVMPSGALPAKWSAKLAQLVKDTKVSF